MARQLSIIYLTPVLAVMIVSCEKQGPGGPKVGGVAMHQAPGVVYAVKTDTLVLRQGATSVVYQYDGDSSQLAKLKVGTKALVHYHIMDSTYIADSVTLRP